MDFQVHRELIDVLTQKSKRARMLIAEGLDGTGLKLNNIAIIGWGLEHDFVVAGLLSHDKDESLRRLNKAADIGAAVEDLALQLGGNARFHYVYVKELVSNDVLGLRARSLV